MSITVATIQTELNSIIGDSSTDRISSAERLQAITEATVWLEEELGNDLQNFTYTLPYFDTVNYYKVTTELADLLEGADLRRAKYDHNSPSTHKSSKEIAIEIGNRDSDFSWSIERRDGDAFIVVNLDSKYKAKSISDMDALTAGGGTWTVDSTNSDATNLTLDSTEFTQGSGSLNFDVDVSQSGNNRATIYNSALNTLDLSEHENLSSWIFDVYIPDVTNFTSVTLYFGSSDSAYLSLTATTDIDGSAFVTGWNTVKFDWADCTTTGTPDIEAIDYIRIDFNYGAGQGDDTDFRIDNLVLVRPENLTFHYLTYKVGTNNSGTDIFSFSATTDIPYFSGKYDHLKFAVAHKAASVIYGYLRLFEESDRELANANLQLKRVRKLIPSSRTNEVKSWKVYGNNLNK